MPVNETMLKDIEVLLAERKIVQTLHGYGHAIDYGDEESWVDLFIEDGVFEVFIDGQAPVIYCAGRKAIESFVRGHPRAPETLHKHLVLNPIISVHGAEADVISYFEMLLDISEVPKTFCFGRYFDRLRCCADGKWRFIKRTARVESSRPDFPLRQTPEQ